MKYLKTMRSKKIKLNFWTVFPIRKFFGEGTVPIAEPSAEGLPTEMELYAMVGNPEYKTNPAYRAKVQKLFKQRFKDDPNIDYII